MYMSINMVQEEIHDGRRLENQWHYQMQSVICRTLEVRWGKPTDKYSVCQSPDWYKWRVAFAQGHWNLLKDIETCSRTLKLAQGHWNMLKDIEISLIKNTETCSRTLKLAKELWNLQKNFGTYYIVEVWSRRWDLSMLERNFKLRTPIKDLIVLWISSCETRNTFRRWETQGKFFSPETSRVQGMLGGSPRVKRNLIVRQRARYGWTFPLLGKLK